MRASTSAASGSRSGSARTWGAIESHVRERSFPSSTPASAVGVAGTITTLAALDLGLAAHDPERVHGHTVGAAAVDEQLARLAALPLEERRRIPGLEPDRAPVIVAGVAILRAILAAYRLDAIEASEHDLLHGAALDGRRAAGRERARCPTRGIYVLLATL